MDLRHTKQKKFPKINKKKRTLANEIRPAGVLSWSTRDFYYFFLKFSSQHPISQRPYLIKKEVRHKTKQTGNEIRLRVEY